MLDGALGDAIYRSLVPATNFSLMDPRPGEPASEQTEVWVFFDDRNLYVAVRCVDSQPDRMVANEMRRDNVNIWRNDNIVVLLDTFRDRQNAFFFQTNPLGGVRDAFIASGNANYDWNTVWDVKSQRSAEGWTTEMVIPFRSLRYPARASQEWGINVARAVRSKNETSTLTRLPPTAGNGLFNLDYAATLHGMAPPSASKNVELKPYATGNVVTDVPTRRSNDIDSAFGFDAKYGVTSSLTADVTYNTDFSQVEIDEQQVNLTRFSLFFPEKREFFLEGQGVFNFAGGNSSQVTDPSTPIVFFTRRIGLEGGQPVSIQAGGRVSGRVGRTTIGVLNIGTEDHPGVGAVATNFSIVRLRQDVLRRSNIGVLVTHRDPSGSARASNQVYGVDANFAFFANLQMNSFYARSNASSGTSDDTESYRGQFNYSADRYGVDAQYLKVGRDFDAQVGFTPRRDFHRTQAHARFSPRPRGIRGVRKIGWEGSVNRYTNSAGVVETRQEKGTFTLTFESSDIFSFDYIRNLEFVSRPFQISRELAVPTGEHRFDEIQAQYSLGSQRTVSGTFTFIRGGYYTGERSGVGFNGRVKLTDRLAVEPRVLMDRIDLPAGTFRPTLIGIRPTMTITPRVFVSALVQYNSGLRSLETNARLRWEYTPGSDLFVVYTDGRDTGALGAPALVNRSVAVKFSRLFRF